MMYELVTGKCRLNPVLCPGSSTFSLLFKQIILLGVVAAGNPVKVMREITRKDKKFWDWGKQVYIDLTKQYLKEDMEPVNIK